MKIIILILSYFLLFSCNTTTKLAKPNDELTKGSLRILTEVRRITTKGGEVLSEGEVVDNLNRLSVIYGLEKIKKPEEDLNKPVNQLNICYGLCESRFTKISEQSYCISVCEKNFKQKSQQ